MAQQTRPTLVPCSYPALVAEQYRALEDVHGRQTEPPGAPFTEADWEAVHQAELIRDAARWRSGPIAADE